MHFGTRSEGGVFQNFRLRCTTATFVYLSHSAMVIPCESARPLPTREKGGDESAPPKKWGVMRSRKAGICNMPLFDRMTGRSRPHLSLREGSEQPPRSGAESPASPIPSTAAPPFPSHRMIPDRSSPSRVRCAASRPGRLRADPKDALLTRGKGGAGRGVRRASRA